MTNSPWEVQPERPRTYFAEIFGEAVQKVKGGEVYDLEVHGPAKSNSNPNGVNVYWAITIGTTPLEVGETYQSVYFGFNDDWNDLVLPSLLALVRAGKLAHPGEIFGKFARYRLEVWRDYTKNSVQYAEKNNADKLRFDESTRPFVERKAHVFEDVYSTREEALAASDAFFGVENDNPDDVFAGNGGDANGDDELKVALMPWLKIAVGKATKGDKVDRKKLQVEIASDPALTAHFSINSPEVLQLIEETEAKADKVPF